MSPANNQLILRIFRARIFPDKKETFSAWLRDEAVPSTRAQLGLVDCWTGEPRHTEDDEFVFVSVWRDVQSLQAFRDLDDPGIRPDEADIIREASVDHYVAGGLSPSLSEEST